MTKRERPAILKGKKSTLLGGGEKEKTSGRRTEASRKLTRRVRACIQLERMKGKCPLKTTRKKVGTKRGEEGHVTWKEGQGQIAQETRLTILRACWGGGGRNRGHQNW